jgi:gamma-glutamyltranspeptidase/glutathione hydrolase
MSLDSAQSQRTSSAVSGGSVTQVMGRHFMVSAGHPLAAQAAARILTAGGNAIDAGVAAGLALGVVHPDMVSFAGVAPILVHLGKSGETFEVSGVGPYPRKASAEFFRAHAGGQIPPGVLRTVVPAAPDSWCVALQHWGTRSFRDVVTPALECAAEGFPLSKFSAAMISANADRYRQFETSAPLYLPGGRPRAAGDLFVQSELAETIQRMIQAEAGAKRRGRVRAIGAARDEFYKGETARRIAAFHEREGGLLTREDLADFHAEVAPALRVSFRDYEAATCGFWCQGPVLLQMLNLVEPFDFAALGHNSPRALHLLVEAMKLAFADREAYYGDPRHVKVPAAQLLSKAYAAARRALIRDNHAWPHLPPSGDPDTLSAFAHESTVGAARTGVAAGLDTSYVCVVDADGNGFSATPSDPSVDSPVVPGVGCVVSPRGSQGWLVPGHASEISPGKRPRLTPAPAMALKGGRLFMPFGTPGGDVQQQAMLQVFLNITALGMLPQEAVESPRVATRSFPDSFWPHADAPGQLDVEVTIADETRAALLSLGHGVVERPAHDWRSGAVCAIVVQPGGTLMAGADPRRGAHAIGW